MITSSGKQNDKEVETPFVYFMKKLCLFHANVHVLHIACVAGGIRGHKGGSLKYRLPKN